MSMRMFQQKHRFCTAMLIGISVIFASPAAWSQDIQSTKIVKAENSGTEQSPDPSIKDKE